MSSQTVNLWRSMSFHNRHVMIKVDQNTPHHVEGRKLGKETEQLDILKNKYVRKQTNHKYGKKKVCFCVYQVKTWSKQLQARSICQNRFSLFFFCILFLFLGTTVRTSRFVQTGQSVWHFGWIFSRIFKWIMTSQWILCKADSIQSLVWNHFQLPSLCLSVQSVLLY